MDRSKLSAFRFPGSSLIFILLFSILFSNCSKPATEETFLTSKTAEEGRALFEQRCFVCHGRKGKGDGPTSQGTAVRPRDLTDRSWQNSIADDQIFKVIRSGGQSVGKSTGMPPNPDLTQTQIQALCSFIRSLDGQ